MNKYKQVVIVLIALTLVSSISAWVIAGDLEPTGDPAPTMHSLEEIYSQNAEMEKSLSWSNKITDSSRFQLVMDEEAVLDRETGLVWERSPDTTASNWSPAMSYCYRKEVANRFGWRLPTVEELATLIDNSNANPTLPSGHPFNNIQSATGLDRYWTITTTDWITTFAWYVTFSNGTLNSEEKSGASYYRWCVRCGHGYDAN
jgi:hypothetical protein